MSISNTDKLDLVTRSNETGIYFLVIVADEEWEDTDEFRYNLQEKLNAYASYFLDGQMKEEYPGCYQDRIIVRISSTTSIPGHALRFIEALADDIREHGIDIVVEEV